MTNEQISICLATVAAKASDADGERDSRFTGAIVRELL